jgi:hypothetical protein
MFNRIESGQSIQHSAGNRDFTESRTSDIIEREIEQDLVLDIAQTYREPMLSDKDGQQNSISI